LAAEGVYQTQVTVEYCDDA